MSCPHASGCENCYAAVVSDLRTKLAAAQSARGGAEGRADRLEEECAALRVAAAEYNDTLARLTAAEGRADRLVSDLTDALFRLSAAQGNFKAMHETAEHFEGEADRLRGLLVDAAKLAREGVSWPSGCVPAGQCQSCWKCRAAAFLARYEREEAADE